MPIAKLSPLAEIPVQPAPVNVKKSMYKDIVVDTKEEPIESMTAYLSGMPWTVTYYPQLLGAHSDLREIDPGANAAFQQYNKIIDLELRVDSSLGTSYDTEGGVTTVTGSAIISNFTPNIKDYFVAEAGLGEVGLFNITNVERLTFGRAAVWRIDYTLSSYARDDNELYTNLEAKVVSTYYYSKERLVEGLSPVLREEDYNNALSLGEMYHGAITRFFRTFFNRSAMLMYVPDGRRIYDNGLCKFLTKIMDSFEAPEMTEVKYIPTDNDRYMNGGNIWTLLIDRQYESISHIYQKATLAPRLYFSRNSWMPGAAYWNADWFIYPVVAKDELAIIGYNQPYFPMTPDFLQSAIRVEAPPYAEKNVYVLATGSVPLIKSVLIDDYYVLSESFYEKGTNLSALEILIRDYLKGNTIDLNMLSALVKASPDWPMLEQFYYTPLLILLMKDAIKGFYK